MTDVLNFESVSISPAPTFKLPDSTIIYTSSPSSLAFNKKREKTRQKKKSTRKTRTESRHPEKTKNRQKKNEREKSRSHPNASENKANTRKLVYIRY